MNPQFSNVISSSLPVRREPPCVRSSCGKGPGLRERLPRFVSGSSPSSGCSGTRGERSLARPDQVVPNLFREPEVGVSVFVDVTELLTAEPVDGDADPARAVFVPPLEDSGPAEHFAFDQF